MSIVINPNVSLVAAQGATADVVLQPGTVVDAKVLQILGNDQVRIAIGGQSIDVASQVPLQAGQTLQLAVSQGSDGSIRLAVVNAQGGGAAASQGIAGAASATATSATAAVAVQTAPGTVALNNQLTPLETLAVSMAAQTAATQQTSLAPLFANLGVAAGLNGLPPQLQQAIAQVLAQRTSLGPSLTGNDIKQAFQSSGLFLEASLASGSFSSSAATPDLKAALIVLRQVLTTSLTSAAPTQNTPATPVVVVQQGTTSTPVVVQQGTTTGPVVPEQGIQPPVQVLSQLSSPPVTIIVGPDTPTTASPALAPLLASEIAAPEVSLQAATLQIPQDILDFSAANPAISSASTPADAAARTAASSAALNLLQEVLQASPLTAGNPSRLAFDDGLMLSLLPAVAGVRIAQVDDAEFARTNVPPPPISGALPAAQPVMAATLVSNSPLETAMHHLLADADGAIARQTLLQVASLPDQVDTTVGRLDPTAPRWNFEIPFATPQGTAMAQFEISRDGGGSEVEAAKRVWRARFSLDVEPAGPIHALVSLNADRTSVRMWAERPATADQLRAGVSQLSQALSRAELLPGDIVIRDGAPVQSVSARAGHFLDRAL
ncbi:MAG: hypothetical protein JWP25_2857 [Bradyrhizobium sp.]|jgi:hypothetical protein|nr:hypothetical protein [Bradyrhizobium sp.]MEA2865632.1 hypothetical protein [Bradyrhizobium sp.]